MTGSAHPLIGELAKVQYDLTALKARVSEIQRQVAALELVEPDQHLCECGVAFRSVQRLAEHRYTSHGAPEPLHWVESEKLAETPAAARARWIEEHADWPQDDVFQIIDSWDDADPIERQTHRERFEQLQHPRPAEKRRAA